RERTADACEGRDGLGGDAVEQRRGIAELLGQRATDREVQAVAVAVRNPPVHVRDGRIEALRADERAGVELREGPGRPPPHRPGGAMRVMAAWRRAALTSELAWGWGGAAAAASAASWRRVVVMRCPSRIVRRPPPAGLPYFAGAPAVPRCDTAIATTQVRQS